MCNSNATLGKRLQFSVKSKHKCSCAIWRNITGNQLPTLQNHFKLTNFLIGESYVFTVKWFSFNDFYSNPSTLAAFEMGKSI